MHFVPKDFPVVCVGGSAGGLDAYIRLLKHLPADMGVAIVIVNHVTKMPTMLHEVLPRFTKMPVELITESLRIRPNQVFIIPANRDLHVLDGEFHLKPISKPRGPDAKQLRACLKAHYRRNRDCPPGDEIRVTCQVNIRLHDDTFIHAEINKPVIAEKVFLK